MKTKKDKRKPIYIVGLSKKELSEPSSKDPTFYDIVQEDKFYIVRYYGVCAIYSADSLEEAKNFIWKRIELGK